VVLIENASAEEKDALQKISLVAEKIRSSLAETYLLNEIRQQSSPSIGVSLFYGNDESVDEVVKRADMAMYQAKNSGRNRVKFFDPQMQQLL
jgi:diguanylate cyclase (GGDEF)-like protein